MAGSLVQQKFGAAAADYAASTVHAKGESLARLVALVDPQRHWRVLDVATGAGHTALALAPHVEHVVASDITAEMLAEAGKLAAQRGLGNVETAHAEAAGLPFPEESFDLVTCRLAAHHFPDPAGFVSESWRVLKSGGVFALVDNISPDTDILPGASREEADQTAADYNAYEKLRDPSHGRSLSLAEWSALLTRTGFDDIRSEHMDQDIAFVPWTQRMRCDAPTIVGLKAMLAEPRLELFLRPRTTDDGLTFTLQEAIVVAKKPAGPR
jgi:ubiquinone/menaquinone biosynthesis C-methylase UbiE